MRDLHGRTRCVVKQLRAGLAETRPVHPDVERALAARWQTLPPHVKTPAQMLGQRFLGCEGTHGVFPKCNLGCAPCYHSRDANQVRVDVAHTCREVDQQMAYLASRRGPGQHAQLIGGEVTLLGADGHADVLKIMEGHGRKPMSMSHGDFGYDYLVALAVEPDGRRRFEHLSFAVHIDSTMVGRSTLRRPTCEAELNRERQRVSDMFTRLRREHGVRSYLAHNMTVTPANLDQVADVVRACRGMGYRMFSFQPAAAVGARTVDTGGMTAAAVWSQIERGAETRLPYRALQVGDARCNRTVWGFESGGTYTPLLDDLDPADMAARNVAMRALPGVDFGGSRPVVAGRLARVVVRHPELIVTGMRWATRLARRLGARGLANRPTPLTFVLHNFMDAHLVAPAWEALQRGEVSDDSSIRAAQERLQACSYLMAHPERDQLVPACAQHAVFDPAENRTLRTLLPHAGRVGDPRRD